MSPFSGSFYPFSVRKKELFATYGRPMIFSGPKGPLKYLERPCAAKNSFFLTEKVLHISVDVDTGGQHEPVVTPADIPDRFPDLGNIKFNNGGGGS